MSVTISFEWKPRWLLGIALCCEVILALMPSLAQGEFVEPSFAQDRSPNLPVGFKPLKWVACGVMKDKEGSIDFGMTSASYQCPKAKILMGKGLGITGVKRQAGAIQLVVAGQTPVHLKFTAQWLAPFLDTVHTEDLNRDGQPDYVLEFSFHGNGLAAVRTQVMFLISDPKGYRFSHFQDVTSPALSQFGSSPGADGGALVATVFTVGRFASDVTDKKSAQSFGRLKGKDGRSHVFFVFDLLGFKANESLPSLIPHEGLPRWVVFQENPGATETTQLSAAEKSKLWVSPLQGLRSGFLRP